MYQLWGNIDLGKHYNFIQINVSNTAGQTIDVLRFENSDAIKFELDDPDGVYYLHLTTSEGNSERLKVIKTK